ncbi:hypothetical protein Tco_1343366 [Tanacetum coccineum]
MFISLLHQEYKALEKASKSQAVIDAIGEPIAVVVLLRAVRNAVTNLTPCSTIIINDIRWCIMERCMVVVRRLKKKIAMTRSMILIISVNEGASPEAYDQLCATIQAEMAKEEAATQAEETQAAETQS